MFTVKDEMGLESVTTVVEEGGSARRPPEIA
jgi:hypothetical protein